MALRKEDMSEMEQFLDISEKLKLIMKDTKKIDKYKLYDLVYMRESMNGCLNKGIDNEVIREGMKELSEQVNSVLNAYTDKQIDEILSEEPNLSSRRKLNKLMGRNEYDGMTRPVGYDEERLAPRLFKLMLVITILTIATFLPSSILSSGKTAQSEMAGSIVAPMITLTRTLIIVTGVMVIYLETIKIIVIMCTPLRAMMPVNMLTILDTPINSDDRYDTAEGLMLNIIGKEYSSELLERLERSKTLKGMEYIEEHVAFERLYKKKAGLSL